MQEKIRLIIIIVLMVLLAVSAFIGIQTYGSKKGVELERDTLKNENDMLSAKVQQITKERKGLEEKVNALANNLDKASQEKQDIQKQYELIVKDRDGMIEKVKALRKDNEQLHGDLSNLAREKQQLGESLETNLAPLKQENAQLKQQLDNLSSLKSKLENELAQLKGEKSDLEQRLNEVDSFLEQRLSKLRYLSLKEQLNAIRSAGTPQTQAIQPMQSEKESVELPAIVVRPQTQSQAETSMMSKKSTSFRPTGTVLEVNRENKFVIIDLGQEVGTKLGDTFKVYKKGAQIATVEVIQLRQGIAACDIKEETTPIEAGDIVR